MALMNQLAPVQFVSIGRLRLRRLARADLPALAWLGERADLRGLEPLAPPEDLAQLIASCPWGQFAVERDHRLIGALAASPIGRSPGMAPHPWQRLDEPPLDLQCVEDGAILMGAGAIWLDNLARDEIIRALTVGRQAVVQQRGLDESISIVRAPSWARWRDQMSPQAFVQQVHAGGISDQTLGPFLAAGWVMRGFWQVEERLEVLLRWRNRRR